MSLNLREITRNIEWTLHPGGIVLTNKNLYGCQFLENERFRGSHERDIVDDNTASMLHSAFFFKPEIIRRIFRRDQTRIGESLPSFPTSLRMDLDAGFVCRMNNEMIVRDRNSLFNYSLERMMGNDRNGRDLMLPNVNGDTEGDIEYGYDLCIIFIDQEQTPSEETVIEDSAVESQEDAHSTIENPTTNIIFDGNYNRIDNAINNNMPIQSISDELKNFEMSERSIPNDEENNNVDRDKSLSHINADNVIYEIEPILDSNDNCSDNVNVTTYVNSVEKLNILKDKDEICENNLAFKSNADNATSQLLDNNDSNNNGQLDSFNFSTLSLSDPSSDPLIESDNCHTLRLNDEELQKVTQSSDSEVTLKEQKNKSILDSKITNYDTISQFQDVETLRLETTMQDVKSKTEDRNVYEEADVILPEKVFKMHSDDKLERDDSFYFTYKKDDDLGTPISLEEGSLMEEFLSDSESLGTPSNLYCAHSQV
ncbi:uncharacterized protein LOC105427978 [Pogonomyrmex barbatus]|uniref:Uncharacterized protein LOC105427978 n=1 Tax=Pogonomyrmex barbatus TaxID=144034 RepID=A0A6I9WGC2_9HYME|nr:uncharacterized protein LOC105427978 [Pogonomyrmex barbatus]